MNALEIAKLVRQECGIAGADTPASFENQTGEMKRVVDWVIQSDLYIQSQEVDWRFLWKSSKTETITGLNIINAPDDLDEWDLKSFYAYRFVIGQGNVEESLVDVEIIADYREWRKTRDVFPVAGDIEKGVLVPNGNIKLDPPITGSYTINFEYYRKPEPLSKNDDEPPYPSRYHRLIVARAKRMYAVYEDAPEILQEAEDEFNKIWPRFEASQLTGQQGRFNADFAEDMVVIPE